MTFRGFQHNNTPPWKRDAIDWIARKIDPEAADWIRANSRVASVRRMRPARTAGHDIEGKLSSVSLRSAVPADTSAIALLVQETISSIYPRYYPDGIVDAFARMHSHDAISTDVAAGRVTVAEMAGKIIGTGTVDGNHISRLFVLPAFQGRGVGSALLDRLEGEVARACDVAVVESSLPACSLYEHRGYQTVSHGAWKVSMGVFPPSILVWEVMEKSLRHTDDDR